MPCARLQSPGRTDPFRVIGYPSRPDRSYMLNEQFTWLTPFSQQASPELTWCDRRTHEKENHFVCRGSALKGEQERLLERLRDPAQKADPVGAVDGAMIVGQRERQHQTRL